MTAGQRLHSHRGGRHRRVRRRCAVSNTAAALAIPAHPSAVGSGIAVNMTLSSTSLSCEGVQSPQMHRADRLPSTASISGVVAEAAVMRSLLSVIFHAVAVLRLNVNDVKLEALGGRCKGSGCVLLVLARPAG